MSFEGSIGQKRDFVVRDYTHASRTFVSDNYALLPKTKRWWHIYFRLTSEAAQLYEQIQSETNPSGGLRFSTATENIVNDTGLLSVLAKTVTLPGIKMDTKKHNNYNKQIININKITYEDINLSFHDDSSGYVRAFWDAYYLYYNQDSRYRDYSTVTNQGLGIPEAWKYDQIPNDPSINALASLRLYGNPALEYHHYGLDTVNQNTGGRGIDGYLDRTVPFLDFVKIYHFSRPNGSGSEKEFPHYVEYTLVNPVITSWEQDTLDYSATESAENKMALSFETLLYATGKLDNNNTEVASWNQVVNTRYDNRKKDRTTIQINNPAPVDNNQIMLEESPVIFDDGITRINSWELESNNGATRVNSWELLPNEQLTNNFDGTGTRAKIVGNDIRTRPSYYNPTSASIKVPDSRTSASSLNLPSK